MRHVPDFREIDVLCRGLQHAKKLAVENFLLELDLSMPPQFHYQNLVKDAQLYRWSSATVEAIRSGIKLAYFGS